ncbi:hypothetical protein TNCV_3857561 [Trichonephila clavipes]|nr:hypothetical protein TNCV_3857561 [Trichonephila clavipes]
MHNATVQQPLTTVSPNWNPTIVMLQAEVRFVNKHNAIPLYFQCTPLTTQAPVVPSQGLRDPSLPCAQSTCHHGQWCTEVGVIRPFGPSFPPASNDDRAASQLLGPTR